MPRFSASLTFLWTDRPFMARFDAAARAGFSAVEYMFPYEHDVDAIAGELRRLGLRQVLFNLPAGDWAAGDRGIATDPGRRQEFRDGVRLAMDVARRLGCPRVNCLVGKQLDGVPLAEQWACLVDNLKYAAGAFEREGLVLLVEPINTFDIPGFFLRTSGEAFALQDAVGAANFKVQYDVYHAQRMEGNLTYTLRNNIGRIGHIQVADAPDRNQPGTGEINFSYLFRVLDRTDYEGEVGLEYRPTGPTDESFDWIEAMGYARA
ncbi:MAG: hydroxypyruvate isomerase family protein [Armatimonadota bacterium]|nr:hydroxypyruvate isomerase family protein [Armatimonadota bacterium]